MSPTERREAEWRILETKALECLENVRQFRPIKEQPLLRTWYYPSFDAYYSWILVKVKGQETSLLRQIFWNRPDDMQRLLGNPMDGLKRGFGTDPYIYVKECLVTQDALLQLEIGRQFNIPIANITDGIYLDGTQFGFETFEFFHNLRLSWHGDGPTAWRELTQWTSSIRSFFAELMNKQGIPAEV